MDEYVRFRYSGPFLRRFLLQNDRGNCYNLVRNAGCSTKILQPAILFYLRIRSSINLSFIKKTSYTLNQMCEKDKRNTNKIKVTTTHKARNLTETRR